MLVQSMAISMFVILLLFVPSKMMFQCLERLQNSLSLHIKSVVLFLIHSSCTQCYNNHFHAYEVIVTGEIGIFNDKHIFDNHPVVFTKPVGHKGPNYFVSLKYQYCACMHECIVSITDI